MQRAGVEHFVYNMKIEVRAAIKKDIKKCVEVGKVPELELTTGGYVEEEDLERWLDKDLFLVAEMNKKIVGYVIGEHMPKSRVDMVWFLVVKEELQNQGIGGQLVEVFEENCRKRKINVVILYSTTKNKKAEKFYLKQKYDKGDKYIEFVKVLGI